MPCHVLKIQGLTLFSTQWRMKKRKKKRETLLSRLTLSVRSNASSIEKWKEERRVEQWHKKENAKPKRNNNNAKQTTE